MAQVLTISNGTTTIDLLNPAGWNLISWTPKIAQWKDGGVVQDSKIAEGKRLRYRAYDSVTETFRLYAVGSSQNDCIDRIQDLSALLEEAIAYWLEPTNDTPVYLSLKSDLETNTRHAVINSYKIEEIPELYNGPFRTGGMSEGVGYPSVFREIVLVIDMGHWQDVVPGLKTERQISSTASWIYKDWELLSSTTAGDLYYDIYQIASGRILLGVFGADNMLYSDDNGATWSNAFDPGGDCGPFLQTTTGRILCWRAASDIYKSDNNGATWSVATSSPATFGGFIMQLSSGKIIAFASEVIWSSVDDGDNWSSSTPTGGDFYKAVQTTTGRVIATTSFGVIYSDDDCATWTKSNLFSTCDSIIQLSNGNILTSSGTTTLIVHKSEDDGVSFFEMQRPSSSGPVYKFLQDSSGIVWAGTGGASAKTLYSTDGEFFGLSSTSVVPQWNIIQLANGDIIAASNDGSANIYKYDGSSTTIGGQSGSGVEASFVANKENYANITHIFIDDGGAFGSNLFPMTLPTTLLPAVPAVNDAIYFGISTAVLNSGPFSSLVFDTGIPAISTTSYTILWEYSNGAAGWPALTTIIKDGTNLGGGALSESGVSSIHFVPPSAFVTETVNGVTGYWVRARVSALSGTLTPPTQQNRNIYTITLPYVDVDEAQVPGDIPSIIQVKARNRSDYDGVGATAPNLYDNRLIVGSRKTSRGSLFQSYINISDEQNPLGVTVTLGTNTAYSNVTRTVTGRLATYNPGGAEAMASRATITFGPTIARDFYGTHHAFVRVCRTAGVYTDFQVRLQVSNGSGGVTYTTDSKYVYSTDDFRLIDFGRIQLPVSGQLRSSELGDSMSIAIQASAASGTPNLYIHDLILIPTDEWATDCVDTALETDSEVGKSGGYEKYLDIDSTNPKNPVKALVRRYGSDLMTSVYKAISPIPAQLYPNTDQRLWFLAARAYASGTHTGADNASSLTDAAAGLLGCGVKVGMIIYNATDGSSATITAVTQTTVAGTLAGGTGNDWDTNDVWYIICPSWIADPEICHSIQLNGVSRYLYPRGNK